MARSTLARANRNYLGNTEAEFFTISTNIYNTANANSVAWSIDAGALTSLNSLLVNYVAAYNAWVIKATRTSSEVLALKTAKSILTPALRDFVKQYLKNNVLVPQIGLQEMGINTNNLHIKATPRPVTLQLTSFKMVAGSSGSIRMVLGNTDGSNNPQARYRGKAGGVARYNVVYQIGGTPPTQASACILSVSQTRALQYHTLAPSGSAIYAFAASVDSKGLIGQYSAMTSIFVP
jgi:hypothetical protein